MSLRDFVGNSRTVALMRRMGSRGRFPSSWLISGPHRIGKRTLALEWAKVLTCEDSKETEEGLDCCDRCRSCRRISADRPSYEQRHPSVLLVDGLMAAFWSEGEKQRPVDLAEAGQLKPKDSLGVDSVRMIQEFAVQASPWSWKVIIVDDAERLTPEGSAALLKVLEEPPEKTLFFLVSSNPWAIAPTVRSRCFPVRMTLVSKGEIAQALRQRGLGKDDALLLASLARGRVGWVFSQIKDPRWKTRLKDWSERVAAICQLELWDIFRFAERWVGEEGEESLADEESIGKRRALEQRLQGFALFFRDMLCRRWGADDLVVNPFWSHRTIDEGWSEAKLADALFFVSRIARQVRAPWNVNPILALEILGAFWARYGGNSPNSKSSQFQTANKEGLQ